MKSFTEKAYNMLKNNKLALIWPVVFAVFALPCRGAQTWLLSPEEGWQNVQDSPRGEFLLAISTIKQQIDSGDSRQAIRALERLKTDWPQFAGDDLDLFIKAETLFAGSKWSRAARQYTRLLEDYPDSPLYAAASERLYSIGAAYVGGQKRVFLKILKFPAHDEGEKILRDLADRGGNSPLAYRCLVTIAENQERRNLFLDAYQTWSEVADRWPTGDWGRVALLRMAQSLHAAYTSPHYDATVLRGAASYFEDYQQRYAESARRLGIADTLDLIVEQQAYKHFFVGLHYERVEKLEAAQMYYRTVLTDWPETKAARMADRHLTALQQGGSALPPKTFRRKLFDRGTRFLDNWFGLVYLFKNLPTGQESPVQTKSQEGMNHS